VADDARYRLLGVFAQHRIPIGAEERVEWISGLRYTHAGAEADRVIDPTGGAPLRIDQDWDTLTGSLRGLLRLDDQGRSKIYFGLSQGYRAPNLSDLTRFDIARSDELEVPARDLDPEQFLCLEAGLRVDASPVRLEAAFYRTWIDGMIVRTPTGRTTDDGLAEVTKRNAGDGYIHGIDGRLDVNLARAWSVWTQVSWMEGEVDGYPTSATEKVREPVSRLMPLTVRAGLKWTRTDGRLWAEAVGESAEKADRLSASDRRDNQRIPPGGTPGYTVCHLRAGYAVTDSLRMSAALENLFDRDYRIHGSGVNESGRNLLLAVEQAF
ncbi:MAG: TonB-dependent receptor, partial [Kiritimatiellia bacterium]|nr:TonB-dependent receptor [Kiritimatiellia bacterium]